MRRAINENPVVQVALIGVLVIVAGFLFMTRVAGGDEEAAPTGDPAVTGATAPAAVTTPAESPALAPVAPGSPAPNAVAPADGEGFVAGPGLPKDVVDAYEAGDTVVLLIVRESGIDDRRLAATVARETGEGDDVALFVTRAKGIATYSRIARGVEVERVPAMVVIRPEKLNAGGLPQASVSYGYRGPQSIAQAIRDANYRGREDLPYYPE